MSLTPSLSPKCLLNCIPGVLHGVDAALVLCLLLLDLRLQLLHLLAVATAPGAGLRLLPRPLQLLLQVLGFDSTGNLELVSDD